VLRGGKKLTAKCIGSLGFTLDEPTQGSLDASLGLAGGAQQCAGFGGDVVIDQPGKFKAKKASPPAVCP
jgi:hypothetical protein